MDELLKNLGTDWKIALGAVILAVAQWLIKKYLSAPTPAAPANPLTPAPAPAPAPSEPLVKNPDGTARFPLLSRLREALKGLPWKEIGPLLLPLILENKAKEKAAGGFESRLVGGQVETVTKAALDGEDAFWKNEVKKALDD